ncbi:uncharacterized protein VSU04_003269 isoform 2-T2 [Chlamydotis macqueenii]
MIWAERRGRFGSGCLAPVTNASFAVPNAGAQLSRFRAEPPRSLRPRLARGPVWPCAREARATLPSASGLPSPSALGLTRGRGRPPSTRPEKARKPAGNTLKCSRRKGKRLGLSHGEESHNGICTRRNPASSEVKDLAPAGRNRGARLAKRHLPAL